MRILYRREALVNCFFIFMHILTFIKMKIFSFTAFYEAVMVMNKLCINAYGHMCTQKVGVRKKLDKPLAKVDLSVQLSV